jgi:hypothetical protein
MINIERLAEKLFGVIKGAGYLLKMYDESGNSTVDPSLARRFFVSDPGFMVTINPGDNEVQFNKGRPVSLEDTDELQTSIKSLANEFLLNYTVKEFGKRIIPKDFSYEVKREKEVDMGNLSEASLSKMYGSKKTSYQQMENVKILVRHNKAVDEDVRGARSRNIQDIFLEQSGEKFRFPHKNLMGARAMARHMVSGGTPFDMIGEHIIETTGQMVEMADFYRYVKSNRLINEDTSDVVDTLVENINSIRRDLKRFAGSKTYESIRSRVEDSKNVDIQEDDIPDLRDMFTVKKFDERFEGVLPVLGKVIAERKGYLRRIEESSTNKVVVNNSPISMEESLSFESDQARIGYKLGELAGRIMENDDLAGFISKISYKMSSGNSISAFESTIIRNVMANMTILEGSDKNDEYNSGELRECIEFEADMESYDIYFI